MELRAVSCICKIFWRKAFCERANMGGKSESSRPKSKGGMFFSSYLLAPVLKTLFALILALAAVEDEQDD